MELIIERPTYVKLRVCAKSLNYNQIQSHAKCKVSIERPNPNVLLPSGKFSQISGPIVAYDRVSGYFFCYLNFVVENGHKNSRNESSLR